MGSHAWFLFVMHTAAVENPYTASRQCGIIALVL